jgi:hypothetical protein
MYWARQMIIVITPVLVVTYAIMAGDVALSGQAGHNWACVLRTGLSPLRAAVAVPVTLLATGRQRTLQEVATLAYLFKAIPTARPHFSVRARRTSSRT